MLYFLILLIFIVGFCVGALTEFRARNARLENCLQKIEKRHGPSSFKITDHIRITMGIKPSFE